MSYLPRAFFTIFILILFGSGNIIPASADVINVEIEELQSLIDQDVQVIDLRRLDEWQRTGVIEQSHRLTFFDKFGGYNAEQWIEQAGLIADPNKPVALICHSGVRSKWVAQWMDKNTDYNTIYNVPDGMVGWIEKGLPVVADN